MPFISIFGTIILSKPDRVPDAERLAALPPLPSGEGRPVFAEPVAAKGIADPAAMLARKDAWADAYRHTPHGKPVELGAASRKY